MKQTNNAIKFLMAQYRAIFQNAYFKGLATAAVVTMGLAVGQAQAVAVSDANLAGTTFEMGSGSKVEIADSGAKSWSANVSVNGVNNTGAHSIKVDTSALTLSGDGSLTVKTGAAAKAISLEAISGQALNVKINKIDVKSGLVDIKGDASDGKATVEANEIAVSGENAKISLTAADQAGAATLGRAAAEAKAASQINLSSGGTVTFDGGAASKAILQGELVSTGGILAVSASKFGQISTFGTAEKLDINVGNSGSATISLADVEKTADSEDTLTINSGTITLSAAANDATLTIDKGNVNLGNSVVLQGAGTGDGKAKVVVGGSANGELTLSKEALTKFLGATTGVASAKKGILDIAAKGTVLFTDETVKLDDLAFAADEAGKIKTVAGAKLGAKNVVVDAPLTGATGLTVLAKDTLTLGKAGFDSANTDLVAKFETKNLNLVTDEDSFTLQNAVTLKAMGDSKDAEGKPIQVAQDGTIVGKAINVSGGSITVSAGNYTFGEDVTLTKGKLEVTSAEKVKATGNDTVASSLKISNGNVTLKATKTESGSISVSGKNAKLDLSEAGALKLESPTENSTAPTAHIVSANVSAGTLVLKGEQVASIVKMIGENSDKASSINLSHSGSLLIVDDLTIDGAKLKGADASTAPNAATINFHSKADESGGTLEVANTLTLTNLDSNAVDIGKDGNIQADKLVLKLKEGDVATEFSLGSGNFTVLSGLDSDKDVKLSSANSVLNLGALEVVDPNATKKAYKSLSTGGEVNANLSLAGTSTATLHVVAGDWKAKDITTAANTALKVGQADNNTDVDGNIIGANLTVNGKLTAAAGVTVNEGSSLTTNEVELSAGSVTVSGGMVLNGKLNDNNTTDTTDDKFGVKLAAGAIVLEDDSKLTIQGDAIKAIQTDASGNVTFASDFDTNVRFT